MKYVVTMLSLILAVGAATPGAAVDHVGFDPDSPLDVTDVFFPEEWEGIWDVVLVVKDCDSGAILFELTDTDTICAGPTSLTHPGFDCSGTATATSFDVTCVQVTEDSGCTMTTTQHSVGTRDGETYTGVSTTNDTFSGDCADPEPRCILMETTATRVSTDTDCTVATRDATWSSIKVRYR